MPSGPRRRSLFQLFWLALVALTAGALAVSLPGATANAAPGPRPNFQLPFPCGQQWRLDSWAHAPALDMVKEPNQVGTEGALLVAPAAGTVNQSFRHSNAGNMIQINHGGGWFTTYIHLQSRAVGVGTRVNAGQAIGRVGKDGPTSNGHPHLHFELAVDANGNGSASWGTANSERVPAWFNGVRYGTANGQTYRNVTSRNCGGHAENRAGIVKTDGSALMKEGSLGAAWVTLLPSGVKQLKVAGDRIGVLRTDGEVLMKDGALNSAWQGVFPASNTVTQIDVTDNRIGILKTDGSLLVKEGAANAAWATEFPSGVTQFDLSGNRIGAVHNGSAQVKEGALNAAWTAVMPGGAVHRIAVEGDRVAILKSDREVLYKEGGLDAAWQGVFPGSNSVTEISVTGDRIGILKSDGSLLVKEGAASSAWATEFPSGVTQFDLSGSRIGALRTGSAEVKEGALNAGWVTVMPGGAVTQLTLG